ncbi:uncharacterized protein N7496_006121 [Penicillium cataractarum]|uniref:Uncharacterized protein n=1 Tax=Penicillium cataractarum TaxID=2100454 RepID=A0A9W9V734_9EURO|nr:uncharacterized protein N7496_006121 [Penicillium cataractarum]KAJ5370029.1 hypothetical protein N7496_006121 [Penicillium cataractarum]
MFKGCCPQSRTRNSTLTAKAVNLGQYHCLRAAEVTAIRFGVRSAVQEQVLANKTRTFGGREMWAHAKPSYVNQ